MTLTESTAYKKNLAELALIDEQIALYGPTLANIATLRKKRRAIKERINSLTKHYSQF